MDKTVCSLANYLNATQKDILLRLEQITPSSGNNLTGGIEDFTQEQETETIEVTTDSINTDKGVKLTLSASDDVITLVQTLLPKNITETSFDIEVKFPSLSEQKDTNIIIVNDLSNDISSRNQPLTFSIINGNPATLCLDGSSGLYTKARNNVGSSWLTSTDIITASDYLSMVEINNLPAVAYVDISSDLRFYYNGSNILLDTNTTLFTDIFIVDGNPAIVYSAVVSNIELRYIRATNSTGSSWGSPVSILSVPSSGYRGLSAHIISGNPAISYGEDNSLFYVRATNSTGSIWGTPVEIDTSGDVNYTALEVVNGRPAIAYSYDTSELLYIRADDTTGSSWTSGNIVNIESLNTRYQVSLKIASGNPAIAYYDNGNGNLKYVRSSDANGSSWNTPIVVDDGDGNNVGRFCQLQIVQSNPAIAYYDLNQNDILYVRATTSTGNEVKDWFYGQNYSVSWTATLL